MFIDTHELTSASLAVDVSFPRPAMEDTEGSGEPVHVVGCVTRARVGFRFSGQLDTAVAVRCARCDRPFPLPISTEFSLLYAERPRIGAPESGEVMLHDEDFALAPLDEKRRIDLTALAREQVYLAMPLKPICRGACRGLCARCGANLNEGACACPASEADPRWSGLATLRRRS